MSVEADSQPGETAVTTWLVGDVGATNARFGLVAPSGAILHSSTFACADFTDIGAAIGAYLAQSGNLPLPRIGALAIAQAVVNGAAEPLSRDRHVQFAAELRSVLGSPSGSAGLARAHAPQDRIAGDRRQQRSDQNPDP
jgi:glucokinase